MNAVSCAPGYGRYQRTDGTWSCAICQAGEYSNYGVCSDCNSGQVSEKPLSTNCFSCGPGFYSPPYGKQTECLPCGYNSVAPYFGMSECTMCLYGYYAFYGVRCNSYSDSHPTFEPVVFPTITTNPPTCGAPTPGPMDEFIPYTSPPTCGLPTTSPSFTPTASCPAGYGFSMNTASGCVICEAGSYRGLGDDKDCKPCGLGTYSNKRGTEKCTRCVRNFYTPKAGARSCKPCPKGYESQFGDYCQYVPTFSPTQRPTRGPSKKPNTRRPSKSAPRM